MYPLITSTDVCYAAQLQWYDIFLMGVSSDWMDVLSHLFCEHLNKAALTPQVPMEK